MFTWHMVPRTRTRRRKIKGWFYLKFSAPVCQQVHSSPLPPSPRAPSRPAFPRRPVPGRLPLGSLCAPPAPSSAPRPLTCSVKPEQQAQRGEARCRPHGVRRGRRRRNSAATPLRGKCSREEPAPRVPGLRAPFAGPGLGLQRGRGACRNPPGSASLREGRGRGVGGGCGAGRGPSSEAADARPSGSPAAAAAARR